MAVGVVEHVEAPLELALDPLAVNGDRLDQVLPKGAAGITGAVDCAKGPVERPRLGTRWRRVRRCEHEEPIDVL